MMKRVIPKIKCLAFCLFVSMSAFAAEVVTVGGLKYELNGSEAYVAGYEGNPTDVVIPATIESDGLTFKVTKVNGGAFRGCTTITSVKAVGSNLTDIGYYAASHGAFEGCTSLVSVSFPYVKKIWGGSFNRCSNLQYVWLGYSLTELNGSTGGVFYNCTMLSYIVIPASCTQIWDNNFNGCSRLQAIIYLGTQTSKGYSNADVYNVNNMLNWSESSFTYSGKSPQPTFTTNLPAGFQPTSNAAQGNLSTNVGTYNVTVPITFKNNNMEFEADIPYSYTVNPARLTAKVKDTSRLYGDGNPEFTSTYTGFVNNEDASVLTSNGSYTTTATAKSDVGTYTITQTGATAQNYVFEYEDGTLTVNKAPLTMTANDKIMTYGSKTPTLDAKYEGLRNDEKQPEWTNAPTFSTTATSASEVGTYPITISNAEAKNYELTTNNGILTIKKAELIVTANNKYRPYGDANPEFTMYYNGLRNGEKVPKWEKQPTIETTASILSPAGTYPISIKDAVAVNYNITAVDGTLTVQKAALQVIPNDATRKYGEDNPEFKLSYVGLKNNESAPEWTTEPVITTTATKNSSVGDYAIQVATAEARNYTIEKKVGILNITKAPLTIGINNCDRKYGEKNPTFSLYYNGLLNGETSPAWTELPTITTAGGIKSDVGEYAITGTGGVMKNYEATEITPGVLTITPASLTIKANDAERLYYDENPAFSFTCTGFASGDDVSVLTVMPQVSTSATKNSNVGVYALDVAGGESKNYTITHKKGQLTINKRQLTVSTKNYTRLYGEENPEFELSYTGFVNNEDEKVLSAKATASTTATKTSDVGTYSINVTGGSADNYTFSYTPGVLTINKAEQTIKWEQDLSCLKVGDQVELKAEVSSGLPITYTMDDNDAAELYSAGDRTYLECKAGGQFIIRAVQNGNKNYYSSPRVSNTVSIIGTNPASDPTLTIKQADNGSVKVQVSKGSVYTFFIVPTDGWKIHTVTFNNTDVTSQLDSDGKFITPAINSNSTLSVVYEQESNAINTTKASQVKVRTTTNGIRITDASKGDLVQVFSIDGVLVKSLEADESIIDIPLTKGEVYIVKVGEMTVKLSF